MADCKPYREEIEESAGVESLSLETRAHAGACRACGEFEREHNSLRRLVGGLGKVEAPADFEFRLRARMKAAKSGGGKYNFLGLRLAPNLAWAAAACFLVVSASLYIWQERRSLDVPQQLVRSAEPVNVAVGVPGVNSAAESEPANIKPSNVKEVKVDVPTATAKVDVLTETAAVKSAGVNNQRVSARRLFRGVSRNESRREALSANASEFSLTGARVLRLKIPLSTSPESLRFVVKDERGNTRPVPMRAVSFGSQELVAGVNARARMVANDKGGVW
jgi:hypothetical protein